ncbi:MAG: universal stress protein [Acidimicrobiia bacterium]
MYQQIVVGTDGSPGADVAVDAAIELARLTGATLHVVHAYRIARTSQAVATRQTGIPQADRVDPADVKRNEAQRICDQTLERAGHAGVRTKAHCVAADPADAILKVAEDTAADLIVVGNRGMSGVRRLVLGSVPNRLSHHSPTSILIVNTTPAGMPASTRDVGLGTADGRP